MTEQLDPAAYLTELRALRETITSATSRAQALNEEEKPHVLRDDLYLDTLVDHLERAEDAAVQAITAAEILAATRGMPLEED